MQLDFKMFWLIVRYRWIEIQRQGNSWVLFFFCFFWSGLNWSCLLLQPVCCCQVISVRLPSVCFLPAQLYCFSPATILHGCTHSPAQPPDAVSDSLVLASSHTYSQGVVKVGFSLLTVIASGGPDCTWVGWIEQAATGWWNLPTASLPGNGGRWWRDRRILKVRWRGHEQESTMPSDCTLTGWRGFKVDQYALQRIYWHLS